MKVTFRLRGDHKVGFIDTGDDFIVEVDLDDVEKLRCAKLTQRLLAILTDHWHSAAYERFTADEPPLKPPADYWDKRYKAGVALLDALTRNESTTERIDSLRLIELTDEQVDAVLDRFDQTEPGLQRRIIAQFVAKAAAYEELRVAFETLKAAMRMAPDPLSVDGTELTRHYLVWHAKCIAAQIITSESVVDDQAT